MLPWSGSRIELVQRLALGFEVGLRVQVRRVKMRVTHPTADDSNVHACRDQVNGRGMPKQMRRYPFPRTIAPRVNITGL